MPDDRVTKDDGLFWPIPDAWPKPSFDPRACKVLADRYRAQGHSEATAKCIESGMPINTESHNALVAMTDVLRSLNV